MDNSLTLYLYRRDRSDHGSYFLKLDRILIPLHLYNSGPQPTTLKFGGGRRSSCSAQSVHTLSRRCADTRPYTHAAPWPFPHPGGAHIHARSAADATKVRDVLMCRLWSEQSLLPKAHSRQGDRRTPLVDQIPARVAPELIDHAGRAARAASELEPPPRRDAKA